MQCKVTEKCFHGGKLLNAGDVVVFHGITKERPSYFEPVKREAKAKVDPEKEAPVKPEE